MENNQGVEVKKAGGNGHKTNWLQLLKNHFTDIKGATWSDENLVTIDGLIDDLVTAIGAIEGATTLHNKLTAARAGYLDELVAGGDMHDALIADAAGLNIAADIIALKAETALIVGDTNEIQVSLADGGDIDNLIDSIISELAKVPKSDAAVSWNATALAAIQAEVESALEDAGRVMVITTIATLASQTSFTLTAGAPDNDAYNGMIAVIEDVSTATQKAIGVISDYVGATKTITLREDPGIFVMAETDKIAIIAVSPDILNILADTNELQTDWKEGGRLDLLIDAITTHLTDIKGGGWANETLVAIKAAIDTIAGVNTYQEVIADQDFNLVAIDDDLTANPPNADAVNSVVDIDAIADPLTTFVLRSLIVNVTSFGAGTKLTFSLWIPVNGAIAEVDSVEVSVLGYQNLMDLFGLQEVHASSIHITVVTDDLAEPGVSACSGTYRYAKAV